MLLATVRNGNLTRWFGDSRTLGPTIATKDLPIIDPKQRQINGKCRRCRNLQTLPTNDHYLRPVLDLPW
jgi:hypothetical protein